MTSPSALDHALDFSGKTVLITGAAGGIGRACAEAFAAAGAALSLVDVDTARLAETAEELGAKTSVGAHARDIGDDGACRDLIEQTLKQLGRIDVLINNAAVLAPGDILSLDPAAFDQVLRVNLRAPFVLTQLAARAMIEKRLRGAVINMSSVQAVIGTPGHLAYVTAKGGLSQLTKMAAIALAPHGVRVNAIGPGSIRTELLNTAVADEATRRTLLARTPMGRFGEPEEIASVALFLASPLASYITGQTIYADGGRLGLNYTVPVADQ